MPLFGSSPADPATRARLGLFVQLASLLVSGAVVWFASLVPRLRHRSLGSLLAEAAGYAFIAWAWSAAITFGVYLVLRVADRGDTVRAAFRTSAVAVWFAPATLLLARFSPAALAAALVLSVTATRLLYSQWRQTLPPLEDEPRIAMPHAPGSFEDCQLPDPPPWRKLAPGLAVSACLQLGAVAALMRHALLGAALLLMGTVLLTAFSMSSEAVGPGKPPSLPRSALGALTTLILAMGLTVGGSGRLLMRGGAGYGWGPDATGVALPSTGTPDPNGGQPAPPAHNVADAAGGFPGVILWPEVKPVTTLIAPVLADGPRGFSANAPRPLSIPFAGEYWMYRWPYARPPHDSFFQRGSPANLGFSTTDRTPLRMEALHKLDSPIQVSCCRKIQMEIWDAERYSGMVGVELLLADTERPGSPPMSLGTLGAASPDQSKQPVVPVREVLDFAVPARHALAQFDEFRVIFYRERARADKSARIEIVCFVLVPRGM